MKTDQKTGETGAPGGIKWYRDYTEDFVESRQQDIKLPADYVWIHHNLFYRIGAAILYGIALIFTFFYTRFALHIQVKNRDVLKKCKDTGCFLYGNHTQPVGDVFAPTRYGFPKRLYTIMSPSNLGVAGIGKILPMLGGLPIPESMDGMKQFMKAIQERIQHKNCIVVYPESHVWPWCNFIRPYSDTAFHFPVLCKVPSFCMTTTYQKGKHGKRPRITVYLDGPFEPHPELGMKEAKKQLHDEIYACMQRRSENSTYVYVDYERESEE